MAGADRGQIASAARCARTLLAVKLLAGRCGRACSTVSAVIAISSISRRRRVDGGCDRCLVTRQAQSSWSAIQFASNPGLLPELANNPAARPRLAPVVQDARRDRQQQWCRTS